MVFAAWTRGAALLPAALALWPAVAAAVTLRVSQEDRGPLGVETTIHLSGDIREGDADLVARRLAGISFPPGSTARVLLASPGGSLLDGIGIGRAIAVLPVPVTADVGSGDRPADCASACVFAYLGGHYRTLREGSRLGVHQFYPTDGSAMTGAEGVALGQVLSAEIVGFLAEARVGPGFFRLMTEPRPEEIRWVPPEDLAAHGVTTGAVRDQRIEYRNADGFFYLTLWQEGLHGENKLLLSCNDAGSVAFIAYLQPPDLRAVESQPHDLAVTLDGAVEAPAMWDLIGTDEQWAIALFTLTPDQMARLGSARSLGARLIPQAAPDLFFGFDYDLGEDGAHVRDMIEGCRMQEAQGFAPASDPEALLAPITADPRASRLASRRGSGG